VVAVPPCIVGGWWAWRAAGVVVMIGRRSQSAELVALLDRARAGRGTAALAVGEAGMGKSTLAEAVATYAEGSGWRVVWGWCGSGDTPPYWPWRAVLDVLDADHPLNAAISGSVDRAQLFSAVARKLARAAVPSPLLVIVEDLHWAGRLEALPTSVVRVELAGLAEGEVGDLLRGS
jgi:ATP/maltotriose-dependent transcriptional regulator MalT